MPLREDLLTPIAGENPSGADLYYDKVFDQIKEARREDDESLPEGDMVLARDPLRVYRENRTVHDHRLAELAGFASASSPNRRE